MMIEERIRRLHARGLDAASIAARLMLGYGVVAKVLEQNSTDAQRGLKRDLSTPRGHADPDAAAGKQDAETRRAAAASPHSREAGGGVEPQPAIRAGEPPAIPVPEVPFIKPPSREQLMGRR